MELLLQKYLLPSSIFLSFFFSISFRYPVILSLENHCSVSQQIVMAKLMQDIFKDILRLITCEALLVYLTIIHHCEA